MEQWHDLVAEAARRRGEEEVFTGNGAPVWCLRWLGGRWDPGEALVGWAWKLRRSGGGLWMVVLDREGIPRRRKTVDWRRGGGWMGHCS